MVAQAPAPWASPRRTIFVSPGTLRPRSFAAEFPDPNAWYQGATSQLAERHSDAGALYQGMTSVVPKPAQIELGFSRCGTISWPFRAQTNRQELWL